MDRSKRKKMKMTSGPTKAGQMQNPKDSMLGRFRMEERRRLMNKRRAPLPGGLVAGAAVSIGAKNKDKIKKKISDIGNMKVKDAVKKIGSGIGALTPAVIAPKIGRALQPKKKQDPVQPKRPRDMRERLKDIRKKIKEGKVKPIPMPKVKEMTPLGKMKKPRPGTYDYQLLQTQKPGYRVAPMLTGGQAKIAAKAPPRNKIDGKDFAVLRAEKAKGRGKGLQDEKMKPGKIMKANGGDMANKKNFRGFSKIFKGPQDKGRVATISGVKPKLRANSKASRAARYALKAARATSIGKIALGVAAAGLGAKEYLKRKMKKNEKRPQRKMGGGMMKKPMMMSGGLSEATQKLKAQGKMGGGMMQRPMMAMGGGMMPGYKKGKSVMAKGCKLGRKKPTKMYT